MCLQSTTWKNPKICLAVLTEYRRVTGGQTDILQHSSRYAASRGKKSVVDIGDTVCLAPLIAGEARYLFLVGCIVTMFRTIATVPINGYNYDMTVSG